MQTISDNIRNFRKASNMSQDELAEKLGVSRQSVSLWETGQTQPTIDNIVALAKIFGTTSDAILATDAETESKTDLPAVETAPEESGKSKKIPVRRIVIAASAALIIAGIALCIIFINNSEKQSNDGGDIPENNSVSEAEPSEKKTEPTQHVTGSVSTSSPAPTAGESENTESTENTNADSDTPEPTFYDNGSAGTVSVPPTEPSPSAEQSPSAETHVSTFDLFSYCKSYAIKIGKLNGDVCMYQQPASRYGGYNNEYFSISYWGDSDMVEFCLHCPLDDTLSINFYLRMRGGYDGKYEYLSSKYYRDNGQSLRSTTGMIDPSVFSDSYPLSCDLYEGSASGRDEFMEESRVGMCDLIRLLKNFVATEGMECDFSAFDFVNF